MTETEKKLRALLAKARREHDGDANVGACGTDSDGNDTRCDRCQRIDAALAEPAGDAYTFRCGYVEDAGDVRIDAALAEPVVGCAECAMWKEYAENIGMDAVQRAAETYRIVVGERDIAEAQLEKVKRERDEARALLAEPVGKSPPSRLVRVLRVSCEESHNGLFRVHIPENEWAAWEASYLQLEKQRDEARAEVERLRSLKPIGTYSMDWNHEQERVNTARAAFKRGADAMREAAALAVHDTHTTGLLSPAAVTAAVRVIRALPVPEDKP
jgi:hypothetical protein